jgi:hypothetical protein
MHDLVFQYHGTLHGRGVPHDFSVQELNAAKAIDFDQLF